MAKQIFSDLGGAVQLVENAGVFSLQFDANLGGGQAAGIVVGQGAIQLNADMALKLGEKLLNSHLPASVQPLASVIEGVANQALEALE